MAQDRQSVLKKLKEQRVKYKYVLKDPMCLPDYHNTGCTATYKNGHTMYGYTLVVCRNERTFEFLQRANRKIGLEPKMVFKK